MGDSLYGVKYLASTSKDKNRASTVEGGLLLHTTQEARALGLAAIDGGRGQNWETSIRERQMYHSNNVVRGHKTRIIAETEADLPQIAELVKGQGLDTILVMMYVLNVLSPDLDPNGNTQAWIDTAVAAQACGLFTREGSEAKEEARLKVTRALLFGHLSRVTGNRTYRDPTARKALSERSYVDSTIWGLTDAEWTYRPGQAPQGEASGSGLPDAGSSGVPGAAGAGSGVIPYNPVTAPRKVYVSLSARWKELLLDPDWREYVHGLKSLAAIGSGQPSGQIARAVGFGFMTHARIEKEAAGKDVSLAINGEAPRHLKMHPRKWWLETFGIDPSKFRPARLVKYWADALETLAAEEGHGGAELIARRGEVVAARQLANEWERSQGSIETWLETPVRFTPGGHFAAYLAMAENPGLHIGPVIIRKLINERGRPGKPAPTYSRTVGKILMGTTGKG
jgi:hypothetical protein